MSHFGSGKLYNDNLIISTQLAVLQSEQVQSSLFTPGNFEEPKRYSYLISYVQNEVERTGKNPEEVYAEALRWDNDTLKDKNKSAKNLIYNYTQVQFHKQNMIAAKLIGVFAQTNVSHAFISLIENATLNISPLQSFELNGVRVGEEFSIDNVLTQDGSTKISNNLAALLAASVDAVKDPVLNLININIDTVNFVTSLLRMGFTLETVSLLCSQPVIKELITSFNIKRAENEGRYVDFNEHLQEKIQELESDHIEFTELEDIKVDNDALISNLNGNSALTNYMVLEIFNRMLEISDAFGDITHMTRYNSITSAVGPFASDTMLLKLKDAAFMGNEVIGESVKEYCLNNPILSGFREGSDRIERQLLGNNFIQASLHFNTALKHLGEKLGFGKRGISAKWANKFTDFYMSYYVNAGARPIFDLGIENRTYFIRDFPKKFLSLKNKYADNSFINSIQYKKTKKEQYGFLELKTRGLSSEVIEDFKKDWLALYNQGGEARDLALALVQYNFFRGSFGFNPKTFMRLIPNGIKSQYKDYINTLNSRNSKVDTDFSTFEDRIIHQFILHNPNLIVKRYKKLANFSPEITEDADYGTVTFVSIKGEYEQKEKGSKETKTVEIELDLTRPFIMIEGKTYFIKDYNLEEGFAQLVEVDQLGGNGQGFEISLDTMFPKSIFDSNYNSQEEKNDDASSTNSSSFVNEETAKVLLDQLFKEDDALNDVAEHGSVKAINRINTSLKDRNIDFSITNNQRNQKVIQSVLNKLKTVTNSRELLNAANKTIEDLDLCG